MLTLAAAIAFAHTTGNASSDEFCFEAKVVGRGQAVLFVSDSGCGPAVWAETVSSLPSDIYQSHLLTLPGFAGRRGVGKPVLINICKDIVRYVKSHHLDHPVFVGHGMGGGISLWLNSTWPDLFGGCVSVDGLPWQPALLDPTTLPAKVAPVAVGIRDLYLRMSSDSWKQTSKGTLMSQMNNQSAWTPIWQESQRSDPAAVGQSIAEMMQIDLRSLIGRMKRNALVFVPGGYASDEASLATLRKQYELQFAAAHSVRFVVMKNSLHFVMQDEGARFSEELRQYLVARK